MRHWGWWFAALLLVGCGQGQLGGSGTGPSTEGDDAGMPPLAVDDAGTDPPAPIHLPVPPPPEPDPEPVVPAPFTCENRTGTSGDHVVLVPHDGLVRTVLLHVPQDYDPGAGTMLVLNFHGFSSADWQESLLTHMNAAADERNFIVAYPQGVATSWNAGDCCGTAWLDAVDDIGFVQAALDELERDYCVDPRRIYSTGMSNGGFISHRIGCEMSDRIAAIAPVAGVDGMDACNPSRPVPIFHFHGTEDPLVPYDGGTPILNDLGGLVFRSVAESMSIWAANNGCTGEPTVFYRNGEVTCQEWSGCAASTRLCTVDGGGHTWPGGLPIPFLGHTTNDIDATNAMLDFFEAHPLPVAP